MGSNAAKIIKLWHRCSVAVSARQVSWLTLPSPVRAAWSHRIAPSSPVSRRRGDGPYTAGWLEAGHAPLASAKLLAAATQWCRCKSGLLALGGNGDQLCWSRTWCHRLLWENWGSPHYHWLVWENQASSQDHRLVRENRRSQYRKLRSTVEPLPDGEIHRDRFQLSTKIG